MEFKKFNINFSVTLAIIILAILAVIISIFYFRQEKNTIVIGDQKLLVEIAQTQEELTKGLSGRQALAENQGMLFIYNGYYLPNFWMKNMLFSIDIIWIKDDIIVGIEKNIPLPSNGEELIHYRPKSFINYVLEVKAGFVDKYKIRIGDNVDLTGLTKI